MPESYRSAGLGWQPRISRTRMIEDRNLCALRVQAPDNSILGIPLVVLFFILSLFFYSPLTSSSSSVSLLKSGSYSGYELHSHLLRRRRSGTRASPHPCRAAGSRPDEMDQIYPSGSPYQIPVIGRCEEGRGGPRTCDKATRP